MLALLVPFALPALGAPSPHRDPAKVEALRSRLVKLGADQASSEGKAAAARDKLAALGLREAKLTAEIAANRAELARLLSALQMMSRDPPPPLLVSPTRANEAIRAAILMRAVEPALQKRAAVLAAQSREIARVRREAALQNERFILAESELADRRAAIAKLAREKGVLETDLSPADPDAEAAARTARDPGALLQRLQTRTVHAAAPTAIDPDHLTPPVIGVLARRWGQSLGGRARSEGLAWRTEPMAEVRAPAAAHVDYAGPLKGWGQIVVLRVSEHLHVVLTGLDRADTRAGRRVAAGEPIGRMGPAAKLAPELYLEVRRDGATIDPTRWLDARPGA